MKTCALISGGKDSTYASFLAMQGGHQIIAIVNLFTSKELDSWMFQSAATDQVFVYAKCFGVDMYRSPLSSSIVPHEDALLGESVPNFLDKINEVELLYALLYKVKMDHPDLQAVVSGAILSSYQRLRIESVCTRLGLVSIAPLWERNQDEVVQEMINVGIEAILVKVAALGLDQRHLGKSITQLQPHLRALAVKYGINVAGEGGEYESFTLDAPFFKYRLEIEDSEVVSHDESAFAKVLILDIKSLKLHWKGTGVEPSSGPCIIVVNPEDRRLMPANLLPPRPEFDFVDNLLVPVSVVKPLFFCQTGSIDNPSNSDVASECYSAFNSVRASLRGYGLSTNDIFHVNVYVRNMPDFAVLNSVYGQFFPKHPPSRATVCIPWPDAPSFSSKRLFLEIFGIFPFAARKKNLHVQSMSNWAPACIGPYAQANLITFRVKPCEDDVDGADSNGNVPKQPFELLSLAGQIALQPLNMTLLPSSSLQEQMALSMAHEKAVVTAMNSSHLTVSCRTEFFDKDAIIPDPISQSSVRIRISGLPRGALYEIQSFLVSSKSSLPLDSKSFKYGSLQFLTTAPFISCICRVTPAAIINEFSLSDCCSAILDTFVEVLHPRTPRDCILQWKMIFPHRYYSVIRDFMAQSTINAAATFLVPVLEVAGAEIVFCILLVDGLETLQT